MNPVTAVVERNLRIIAKKVLINKILQGRSDNPVYDPSVYLTILGVCRILLPFTHLANQWDW